MRNSQDTIAITFVTLWSEYQPSRRRQLYNWLVKQMTNLNAPPRKIGFKGCGESGKKYKSFARMRQKIEQADFAQIERFELHHGPADSDNELVEFDIISSVARKARGDNDWSAMLKITPSTLGISEEDAIRHMTEFAALTVQRYGFAFWMARERGPGLVAWGITYGEDHGRSEEESANLGYWGSYRDIHEKQILLRDVYPVNFLSRPYLDLPIAGTTLKEWIIADSSRGVLEPLDRHETIMTWRPTVKNIPTIREELFKAGALFYYKFFQTWEPDNPWKRDFSKPFHLPAPVPEIFRADYYKDRDPRITR